MFEVRKTQHFARWLDGLSDLHARARIQVRIERLRGGNPGDVRPVGSGVSELRVHHGPGYRVHFVRQRGTLVVLLAGGTKKTQARDIAQAIQMADTLEGLTDDSEK